MKTTIVATLALLASCANHSPQPGRATMDGCGLIVMDERSDIALPPEGHLDNPLPSRSLQSAVRTAACEAGAPAGVFAIDSYTCDFSTFLGNVVTVEISGDATRVDGVVVPIEAGLKIDPGPNNPPSACSEATDAILPLLAERIRAALAS